MELRVRQDNTLRIARRTTGVENIGYILIGGFLLSGLHLRLTGQIVAEFQEIGKIYSIRIVRRDMHQGVEHDNAL